MPIISTIKIAYSAAEGICPPVARYRRIVFFEVIGVTFENRPGAFFTSQIPKAYLEFYDYYKYRGKYEILFHSYKMIVQCFRITFQLSTNSCLGITIFEHGSNKIFFTCQFVL